MLNVFLIVYTLGLYRVEMYAPYRGVGPLQKFQMLVIHAEIWSFRDTLHVINNIHTQTCTSLLYLSSSVWFSRKKGGITSTICSIGNSSFFALTALRWQFELLRFQTASTLLRTSLRLCNQVLEVAEPYKNMLRNILCWNVKVNHRIEGCVLGIAGSTPITGSYLARPTTLWSVKIAKSNTL